MGVKSRKFLIVGAIALIEVALIALTYLHLPEIANAWAYLELYTQFVFVVVVLGYLGVNVADKKIPDRKSQGK